MKTALECIPCFVRQAMEAIEMSVNDVSQKKRLLRHVLREISIADWTVMPVVIAQRLQRLVREETGQGDPYRIVKDQMNQMALDLLPALAESARCHQDSREAVVRLAIAGNLLDSGSKSRIALEDLSGHLDAVWDRPLVGSVAELFEAAAEARTILYLADNAGEIVFDRLLIEALPIEKIRVAVRGFPVINDATLEDARTAGISQIVPVISNGSDAPGTLIDECSGEFRHWYNQADMIISKGQGNYETLSGSGKPVFFLLTVKCPMIAADIGAPVGALVVKRERRCEKK